MDKPIDIVNRLAPMLETVRHRTDPKEGFDIYIAAFKDELSRLHQELVDGREGGALVSEDWATELAANLQTIITSMDGATAVDAVLLNTEHASPPSP